jgi:hypothetical protein
MIKGRPGPSSMSFQKLPIYLKSSTSLEDSEHVGYITNFSYEYFNNTKRTEGQLVVAERIVTFHIIRMGAILDNMEVIRYGDQAVIDFMKRNKIPEWASVSKDLRLDANRYNWIVGLVDNIQDLEEVFDHDHFDPV